MSERPQTIQNARLILKYRRRHAAWFRYWEAVRNIQDHGNCTFEQARQKLHSRVDLTKVKGQWPDERVLSFMRLLGPVRHTESLVPDALDRLRDQNAEWESLPSNPTIEQCVGALCNGESGQLCFWLANGGDVPHLDLLKTLFDDLIYDYAARFEHDSKTLSIQHEAQEKVRQAAMHPNLQRLQKIGNGFRFICSVHYPWNHPNAPVQGTATFLNDGFPAFRLMPVDPATMDRFTVIQVCDKKYGWFLYDQHNVIEGREMTLDEVAAFLEDSKAADYAKYPVDPIER